MNYHRAPHTWVGEVCLSVTNLAQSIDFYKEMIGLRILQQTADKVIFTANGQTPILTLRQPADIQAKEAKTTGLYHFALLLPTRADLGSLLKHLAARSVPLSASDHQVSEALYLQDPDGHGIEIYVDRPSTLWEWKDGRVKMSTDPLNVDAVLQAGDDQWAGIPQDTIIGHIHLHVADLQEAAKFYQTLGFTVVSTYPNALFLSTGSYHHHIALNTWQGVDAPRPSANHAAMQFFTIVFSNEAQQLEVVEQLKCTNAPLQINSQMVLVEDPSGNCIQFRLDSSN